MDNSVNPSVTLVVPCFNEARRLQLPAFAAFLSQHPSITVLFVDDGSRDETGAMLHAFVTSTGPQARLLALGSNMGKAEAVRVGLRTAIGDRSDVVGFWDADLATPLEAVTEMLEVLHQRADVQWVFGSRVRLMGRAIDRQAPRHYLGRVFATAASLVLDMPIYDTQCGAKLFRVSEPLRIVLDAPFRARWVFDVEMLARYSRAVGASSAISTIYEQPLMQWRDVGASKVHLRDIPRAILDLIRIYWSR